MLPTSAPSVQLFNSTSNVYGRAHINVSTGVVRYLGRFDVTAECETACLGYVGPDGANCNSFTHHHADFPQPDFAGACYAVADHSWTPVSPADKITSGLLSGGAAQPACGGGAFGGCTWQADPVCLTGADAMPPATMTIAAATAACAGSSACVGIAVSGLLNATAPLAVSFKATTVAKKNGNDGCWALRKSVDLEHDPYRPGFHFLPPANWMNDPSEYLPRALAPPPFASCRFLCGPDCSPSALLCTGPSVCPPPNLP